MYDQNKEFIGSGDFMPPREFKPGLINFEKPLELKDQHLVSLANSNGFLAGRITELERANYRLENENGKLEKHNKELRERNTELERRDSGDKEGYKSGRQLVDEIEEALKDKKVSKK